MIFAFGRVTKTEIRKNKDSKESKTMAVCAVTDPEDLQTVEIITPSGEEARPEIGDAVLILPVSGSYKIGIAVDDLIPPTLSEGEKEIYSKVGLVKKAFIRLLKTGAMLLDAALTVTIQAMTGITLSSQTFINLTATTAINLTATTDINLTATTAINLMATTVANITAGGAVAISGAGVTLTSTAGSGGSMGFNAATGAVELNGNTNFAVKYTELAAAFNTLKAEFDAHTHAGVTVGPGSTATPSNAPSAADITLAQSTKVRLT